MSAVHRGQPNILMPFQLCAYPDTFVSSGLAGGIKPEEYDAFHELILIDELSRCGSGGVLWAISGGLCIGLPPILHFSSPYLKEKVAKDCLTGNKVICLAITEPYAGSDVATLQATAKKSADGKYYIVNGEKKWITNGVYADFFTVAVRTGGPGMGGVSLLLVERGMQGVTTKQMLCTGVWPSGTAYITFEDVKVPVENLIGEENVGFKCIKKKIPHTLNGFRYHVQLQPRALGYLRSSYSFRPRVSGGVFQVRPQEKNVWKAPH